MNDYTHFDEVAPQGHAYRRLARWLQEVLLLSPQKPPQGPAALSGDDYHPRFYFQLPDFIMALLQNDQSAALRYAPLLYHLAGCPTCHSAYLELYDAMRFAVTTENSQPIVNTAARPLTTIPTATLVKFCQLLISQAEALLRQAWQDTSDAGAAARSLLQMAMRVSTAISQSSMRSRALQDLVRVATLFEGLAMPGEQGSAAHTYSSLIAASGGPRHGTIVRRADTSARSAGRIDEQAVIYLRAHALEGNIIQQGELLQLRLHDLEERLRGRYLSISVPLGSLIEPIRWSGGNPYAIRSSAPVDKDGNMSTLLGQTDLRLDKLDERSLLEVVFQLLEIRPVI